MQNEYYSLDDLLIACTVRVETRDRHGTGFFVAPGLILTCAHIVEEAFREKSPILIRCKYNNELIEAGHMDEKDFFPGTHPDLAILRVDVRDHPCVLLGPEISSFDNLYSYGYTVEHPDGESVTVQCEGQIEYGGTLIKLKDGQVKSGASGSPLLNKKTGCVCGMITNTRDRNSDLGGAGLPVTTIYNNVPELREFNSVYHTVDLVWSRLLDNDNRIIRSNSVSAILYADVEKMIYPRNFVGREDTLVEVTSMLAQSRRVLLTGMAGIGKTALVQVLAYEQIKNRKGQVIWAEVKNETAEAVIEALAKSLGDDQISKLKLIDEKIPVLRGILDQSQVGLVVLENVHNVMAVDNILDAIPERLPVLITSRRRFAVDEIVEVHVVPLADALSILEKTSGFKDLSNNNDALFLCEQLGYHPYALELSGSMMRELNRSPKELRKRLAGAPLELMSSTQGRLRALLDDSVANLDANSRIVMFAFGVFPSNGATSSLLASYLKKRDIEIAGSLDELIKRNLIKRRPSTEFYFVHDLTFHYVESQSKPDSSEEWQVLIEGIFVYLSTFREDFDLLEMDLPNLLSVAESLQGVELVKLVSFLTIGDYPLQREKSFTDVKGYSLGLTSLLEKAIEAARDEGDLLVETLHYLLGKSGNAAFQRGEYALAAQKYEEELLLSPSEKRKVIVGSIFARTLAHSGSLEKSRKYFQDASKLADDLNDDSLRIIVLEQEGWAAGYLRDFEYERQVARKQLLIAEAHYKENSNNKTAEDLFYALLNLGVAELELAKQGLGDFETASGIHDRALKLAENNKSELWIAFALTNLGEEFHYLGKKEQSALMLYRAREYWYSLNMSENAKYVERVMRELDNLEIKLEEKQDEQ